MIAEGSILASKYEIEARLGEGGMGVVYRARHLELGRKFAIKVLRTSLVSDPVVLARFRREAELAGRLRHDNVVSVVDLGVTQEGENYLVMEYAPGETLSTLLEPGPLPQARVLDIARQLCDGLQHAHDAGLIHRDFKPDNVIVDKSPRGTDVARIADFGVAILLDNAADVERERLTTKGIVVDTPRYMAPEHARGGAVDHRADLFSLGLILYEMLAGTPPYDGTGAELARANVHLPTPPMGIRAPGVHVEPVLEALVRNLLSKDPDDRLPTASAVRELLDLYIRDHRTAAALLGVRPKSHLSAGMQPMPHVIVGRGRSANHSAQPYQHLLSPPAPQPAPPPPPADPRASEPTLSTSTNTRRALVIAIAIGACVFLGGIWIATRGTTHGRRSIAASPVEQAATPTPAPSPAPSPSPAPENIEEPPPPAPVVIASTPSKKPTTPRATPPPTAPSTTPRTTAKPPPRPARQLTASEVAMLYKEVGRALSQLQKVNAEKADELWTRYRWIRLSDALTSPEKRAAIVPILDALYDQAQP